MPDTLFQSDIKGLRLRHRGKVRDIYDVDDRHMLQKEQIGKHHRVWWNYIHMEMVVSALWSRSIVKQIL